MKMPLWGFVFQDHQEVPHREGPQVARKELWDPQVARKALGYPQAARKALWHPQTASRKEGTSVGWYFGCSSTLRQLYCRSIWSSAAPSSLAHTYPQTGYKSTPRDSTFTVTLCIETRSSSSHLKEYSRKAKVVCSRLRSLLLYTSIVASAAGGGERVGRGRETERARQLRH